MINYNIEYQLYTAIIHMKEQSSNVDTQQLLKLLVEYDWLEGTVLGIAKQAISKGYENLTRRQQEVLDTYALNLFEGFDCEDIFMIADMGYDGKNTKILDCAREIKAELGYIPDDDSREGDLACRWAIEESYE